LPRSGGNRQNLRQYVRRGKTRTVPGQSLDPIGEVVLGHRRRLGLTQQELAAKAGVSLRGLRDLERGVVKRPHARSMNLLAAALGIEQLAVGTAPGGLAAQANELVARSKLR
jgi:transcriptional regulator with XRE-family HTH domain